MSSVIPHPPDAVPGRGLLRTRGGHEHSKVTFVELFFDLVFVFAVTQLSHSLLEHFTPLGAVQTLLLMLAVWWVWIYTSWVTNWLDPEKLPVRFLLLGIMLAGLVMSASLPMAFESRGIAFATAYVVIQVGRTTFFLWAVKGRPGMVRNFQRILAWLVLAGILWIAGAFAHGPGRLALWAIALGLDYISPSLGFWVPGLGRSSTSDWDVEGDPLGGADPYSSSKGAAELVTAAYRTSFFASPSLTAVATVVSIASPFRLRVLAHAVTGNE